jgi:lipid-A-disaccharide synthase-like uncharacterized protein
VSDQTTTISRPREHARYEPPATKRWKHATGWVALAIVAVSFVVYWASPVRMQTDSYWAVYTARSLVRSGDADLDEYRPVIDRAAGFQVESHGGHQYYAVPLGTSLAAVPVVAIASTLDAAGLDDALARGRTQPYDGLAAAFVAALACGVLFLTLARATRTLTPACIATLAFAFGTQQWSTASRTMWMHGPSVLALVAALYCAVRARRSVTWFGPLGAMLAVAYFVRPTNAVAVLCFGIWAWTTGRSAFRRYALSAAAVAVAFAIVDQVLYGQVLQSYFRASRLALSGNAVEALLGNLVSPGRGLLVFVPLTFVAVCGVSFKIRAHTLDGLDVAIIASAVGYWVVVSLFPHWWGGYSFGPRFLDDVTPFIAWFLLPTFSTVAKASRPRMRAGLIAVAVLILTSVAINARGAIDPATAAWNWTPTDVGATHARLWDWTDLQFLR